MTNIFKQVTHLILFSPEGVSDEHEAFRHMWASLQSTINPRDISGILYEKEIISRVEREEIDNERETRHTRATALLQHVERKINMDKKNFWILVEVLQTAKYNELAMQLQSQVHKGTAEVVNEIVHHSNKYLHITSCHHIDCNNS